MVEKSTTARRAGEFCEFRASVWDILKIFFLYRRILIQIVNELNLGAENETFIPDYDSRIEAGSLFTNITESISRICAAINSRHDERNLKFDLSVIGYIDENITNPGLYTRLVTDFFHISELRLQSIVRRQADKSFLEYVESKRMNISMELLQKTDFTISQIAKECGYANENSFYKTFRRFYNMPPGKVRQNQITKWPLRYWNGIVPH